MRSLVPLPALLLLLGLWAASAAADFEAGLQAFDRGDLDAAGAEWLGAAEAGDRRAQYGLGRLLLLKGDTTGLRWVRTSADAGYLPAELRMAHFTYGGLYLPVDQTAVQPWLRKAAGHEEEDMRAHPIEGGTARLILAQIEAQAQSDIEQAVQYLRQAADTGDAAAQLDYVMNLEKVIDADSSDPTVKAKDPRVALAHAYAIISASQDADVGAFIFTPRRIADRLHEQMSKAQRARSEALVREWHAAKDAGRLGWLYDRHRRQLSLGEQAIALLEKTEEAMGYLRLELAKGTSLDPRDFWLRRRTPIDAWAHGMEKWIERWEVQGRDKTWTKEVTFARHDDGVLWEFREGGHGTEEIGVAHARARALLEAGNAQGARTIWMGLAEQGDAAAELALGRFHEEGLGGKPDLLEALTWYVLAGRLGSEQARQRALSLRKRMTPTQIASSQQKIHAWMDPPGSASVPALFPIHVDEKVGYIDSTGRVVVPPLCDGYLDLSALGSSGGRGIGDYAPVRSELVPVLRQGWWNFVDTTGESVGPGRFQQVGPFREGRAPVQRRDKWGYVNRKGVPVAGMFFDEAAPFESGVARVRVGEQVGLIDTQGIYVVPLGRFEDLYGPREGIVLVRRGEKTGYLEAQTGALLTEALFDIGAPFEGGMAGVVEGGRRGLVDLEGRHVELAPRRDREVVRQLSGALFVFREGERFGILDAKVDRVVQEPRYEFIGRIHQGMVLVNSGGKHGFLDGTGAEVVAPRFDEVSDFSDGLAAARMKGEAYGYIDPTGAWAIAPTFARAGPFRLGLALVQRRFADPYAYIDLTGKTIYTFP